MKLQVLFAYLLCREKKARRCEKIELVEFLVSLKSFGAVKHAEEICAPKVVFMFLGRSVLSFQELLHFPFVFKNLSEKDGRKDENICLLSLFLNRGPWDEAVSLAARENTDALTFKKKNPSFHSEQKSCHSAPTLHSSHTLEPAAPI